MELLHATVVCIRPCTAEMHSSAPARAQLRVHATLRRRSADTQHTASLYYKQCLPLLMMLGRHLLPRRQNGTTTGLLGNFNMAHQSSVSKGSIGQEQLGHAQAGAICSQNFGQHDIDICTV